MVRGLPGWSTAPIVILSGRTDSADKVDALDDGADDYGTKPFSVDELLRRTLEPDPARPRHLLTDPGMGYRFQPQDRTRPSADLFA